MANAFVFISCYLITVLVSFVTANEEPEPSPVTINRPVMRTPKSWHFSNDYVRCFCNLPSCVTTGYMCKSSVGGCFSDLLDHTGSIHKGRHGCLELLGERDQRVRCQTRGGMNERTIIRRKENSKSLFLCCHHDMCNHIESPHTKNLMNNSLLGDASNEDESRIQQEQEEYLYSNSDVWFRAATIAVPICGAVILFVLVALAVKILKSEHHNSAMQKLGPSMYDHRMPQHCKSAKSFDTYDNLLHKEVVPTHHHNVYFPERHQVDPQNHSAQIPLLMEKNFRNIEANSGKTIMLEIEKSCVPHPDVNIVDTYQVTKFPHEKSLLP